MMMNTMPMMRLLLPLLLLSSLACVDAEWDVFKKAKKSADKAGRLPPPRTARLWRSGRERAVWMKDFRRARLSGCLPGVAYAAAVLLDRTTRLAERLSTNTDQPLAAQVGCVGG